MKHISIQAFKETLEAEKDNPSVDFINVCMPAEYREGHIEGVRNVPLDEIADRVGEFTGKGTVYVHCRSGNRSQKAIEKLESLGAHATFVNVEGGLSAWESAGHETGQASRSTMPIMRQVLLAAGSLILFAFFGHSFIHHAFLYLALFVGLGLTFSGASGWCGMALVLSKMPWNK